MLPLPSSLMTEGGCKGMECFARAVVGVLLSSRAGCAQDWPLPWEQHGDMGLGDGTELSDGRSAYSPSLGQVALGGDFSFLCSSRYFLGTVWRMLLWRVQSFLLEMHLTWWHRAGCLILCVPELTEME